MSNHFDTDIKKRPLVIIAGPTATGKTAVSVELAKRLKGSVISADSMQVYRGMDVGSAKVVCDVGELPAGGDCHGRSGGDERMRGKGVDHRRHVMCVRMDSGGGRGNDRGG